MWQIEAAATLTRSWSSEGTGRGISLIDTAFVLGEYWAALCICGSPLEMLAAVRDIVYVYVLGYCRYVKSMECIAKSV